MMNKIRSLKRKRVRDLEEHSDEDEDDRYEKNDKPVDKQPQNAKGQVVRNSKPNTRSVVSSSDLSAASVMAALNAVSQTHSDLLAVARYGAVIFFQTAAIHGEDVKSNNPYRTEDSRTAITLDEKLQRVWSRHPNYHFIPAQLSFMAKINHGLQTIAGVRNQMPS